MTFNALRWRVATFVLPTVMAISPLVAAGNDNLGWNITAELPHAEYSGATVANGRLGITSSDSILHNSWMILGGVFDQVNAGDILRLHRGWNMLNMELTINSRKINTSDVSHFRQTLNLRHSAMESSFTVPGEAEVDYTTVAVGGAGNSAYTEVTLKALEDITIQVGNLVEKPQGYILDDRFNIEIGTVSHGIVRMISALASTPMKRVQVSMSSGFVIPAEMQNRVKYLPAITDNPDESLWQGFTISLTKGESFTFALAGSTYSDNEVSMPQRASERAVTTMELQGLDAIKRTHSDYWDKMWQGDIEITGNIEDQQEARYMLYSIYSAIEPSASASPSPFGLTTDGYSGHVFWDSDLWMYRPMEVLNPPVGKSMVTYRCDRLPAALENKRITGGRCLYPWESADAGEEETPVSATTGVQEIHVSACVALAVYDHFLATADTIWLREKGYPVLKATADFWSERARKENDGLWHIHNVVGADEYAENVDDNAFTNGAAKKNLLVAAKVATMLGEEVNPMWEEVAHGMAFHTMPGGATAEFRNYDGTTAKQADVNLLAYPLGEITDREQILRDLDFYSKAIGVGNGPAMTEAIFAILYAREGLWDKAELYFNESYKKNRFGPFRGISECKYGRSPYFITGAGGALQAILMGYGGLDFTNEGVKQIYKPAKLKLPNGWKRLTIHRPGHEPLVVE